MKILVVCLGNICRSPVAEGILLDLVKKSGRKDIVIDSAGTSNYHIDEAPDKRTIANAKKHYIDLSALRARQFVMADFENFDLILGMDKSNVENIKKLSKHPEHLAKVNLFLDAAFLGEERDVPDPYYGTESDFEQVFQLVKEGSEAILKNIKQSNLKKLLLKNLER
jgi:protein-tyrosine phosphatase